MKILPYPDGKRFACTFTDDTDWADPERVRKVYEFIDSCSLKVTKTVWVFPAKRKSGNPEETGLRVDGCTLQDRDYLELVRSLQKSGHEIALHMASGGNNTREETIAAYEMFKTLLGQYPKVNINHGRNAEGMYWNRDIYANRCINWLASVYISDRSEGHVEKSSYFWGDICKKHTMYMRSYKSCCLNTLKVNRSMPYIEKGKPFVNGWFSATDLAEPWLLKKIITDKNMEQLIKSNGSCIGYTYFHKFVNAQGELLPEFIQAMELLKKYREQGWFVPVSDLLERLKNIRNLKITGNNKRFRLINCSSQSINDVWLQGTKGDCIQTSDGETACIGDDGLAHFRSVKGDDTGFETQNPVLPALEFLNMQLHQIYVLMLRHIHGRKFTRKGWK